MNKEMDMKKLGYEAPDEEVQVLMRAEIGRIFAVLGLVAVGAIWLLQTHAWSRRTGDVNTLLNQAGWLISHGWSPGVAAFLVMVVEPILIASVVLLPTWFVAKGFVHARKRAAVRRKGEKLAAVTIAQARKGIK
ncbi:hypothetical protein [Burkholderia cenocepacia]|uniref:hypothetical protein n=1 Tax=Burkholderia cenocepacia TaxID=95486 RepID=UPI00222F4F46|nr:hypothetical protein [Burkholderia cenocepacia]MCW3632815.1 hypothetical protein [Burkholderia cenocepacia]MCW5182404.1 hypothetical protein [Burkholderia cenocepacia]